MVTLPKKSSKDLKSCDNLISELEGIMKNSNPHWPDPQIIAQSETPGTKSQFLKYGENPSDIMLRASADEKVIFSKYLNIGIKKRIKLFLYMS